MKTFSFKQFNKKILSEGLYGITHLEDLPIETFVRLLKNLHKLHAVQKLDGANLLLGVDIDGKLYTSREQKGGKRFYKLSDFPKVPAYEGFKTAHAALIQVEEIIKKVLKPGTSISTEIIFGNQPNTVMYGKDNKSWIAFLEPVQGDDPTKKLDYSLSKNLISVLGSKSVNTNIETSDTTDGMTIVKAPKAISWGFTKSDIIKEEEIQKIDISESLGKLEKFLEKPSSGAHDLGYDLSNYELIKDKNQKLSEARKDLQEKIRSEYMIPIKNEMMKIVKKQKPSLRSSGNSEFSNIEGIIFTDRTTRENFKVVDREDFTAVNKFNYQIRNRITGRVSSANNEMSLESRGGLVGDAKTRCIRLFGIDGIELPGQAKKNLELFKGDDREKTKIAIAKSLSSLQFNSIKRKMSSIFTNCLSEINDDLDDFKSSVDTMQLELPTGKIVKYSPEVKRRTLMTYAESIRQSNETLIKIRNSTDFTDLLEIFVNNALSELHETI